MRPTRSAWPPMSGAWSPESSPISWSSASPRTAISATGLAGMWSGSSSSEAPSNSTVHSDRGCPSFAGGGFFSPTRIPRCRSLMIARTWHGVTATSKADAYFQVLQDTGLKEYRDTPGNQGGIVLRRTDGDVTHFLLRSEEHTSELQSPYDLVCR